MSQSVQFDEPSKSRVRTRSQKPAMIRWVLATGIVNTQRQAEYALLGIAVIAVLITGYLLFGNVLGSEDVPERYQYNEEEYDPARDPEEPTPPRQ